MISISLLTILLSPLSLADELKQNGEECSCFVTNGSSSGYFSYHRFHDFRNVQTNSTAVPAVIESYDDENNLVPTSDFFGNSSGWTGDWDIQTWNNSAELTPDSASTGGPAVLMRNSASNVYIEQSNDTNSNYSTYLTLRTSRLQTFQTVAEIDSNRANYLHLSARFLARISGPPGACAGMFTYLTNTNAQKVQEIDTEILTSGPKTSVQYTNQPSTDSKGNSILDATSNSTIPQDLDWTQWNVYRVDWMPKASTWFVNGVQAASIEKNVPSKAARLIVNMWGDGGEWTGNMSVGGEAVLQIQWIEVAFNTSGKFAGAGSSSSKRSFGAAEQDDDDYGVLEGREGDVLVERREDDDMWERRKLLENDNENDNENDEILSERDPHNAQGHLLKKRGHKGCAVICSIDDNVNNIGTPSILSNNSSPAPKTPVIPGIENISLLFPWLSILVAGSFALFVL